jgi:hypothetical protein
MMMWKDQVCIRHGERKKDKKRREKKRNREVITIPGDSGHKAPASDDDVEG